MMSAVLPTGLVIMRDALYFVEMGKMASYQTHRTERTYISKCICSHIAFLGQRFVALPNSGA